MRDDDWYKPHRPPDPPRQPQPGELLFEFYRERDHSRWRCELRDHGDPYGVEAQCFQSEELFSERGIPDRPPLRSDDGWDVDAARDGRAVGGRVAEGH